MSVRTQLAYLAAGLTLALGLLGLLNPLLTARLIGLEVVEPHGLSEIRATYGALFVVLGGLMLWAVPTRPRNAPLLRFAGLVWLAVALGRLSSIVIDGPLTPPNFVLLGLELLIGGAAVVGSFQTPRRRAKATPEEEIPDPLRAYRS